MSKLNIQRWKPEAFLIGGEPEFNMLPSRKGDFILHDVAQVEFDRLTARVEELKAALKAVLEMNFPPEYYGEEDCTALDNAEHLLTRIGEDNTPTPQGE